MDITTVPFNQLIGLRRSQNAEAALLQLEPSTDHLNHLGTVHASAQFALAEACSGEYLLRAFAGREGDYAPVVRRAETKFRKPATGRLSARATVASDELQKFAMDLDSKKRALISVTVEVFDENNIVTMSAGFEWFIQRINT
jgi:acyl-coenzyme A thioesterase PaaI-like protein